jgi:hypothetical protein
LQVRVEFRTASGLWPIDRRNAQKDDIFAQQSKRFRL